MPKVTLTSDERMALQDCIFGDGGSMGSVARACGLTHQRFQRAFSECATAGVKPVVAEKLRAFLARAKLAGADTPPPLLPPFTDGKVTSIDIDVFEAAHLTLDLVEASPRTIVFMTTPEIYQLRREDQSFPNLWRALRISENSYNRALVGGTFIGCTAKTLNAIRTYFRRKHA